jgi:sec-independent protein translocase protein TatC
MALLPAFRSPDRSTPDDPDGLDDAAFNGGGAKMTFLEHLDELRKRLTSSLVSILVGCVIAFTFVGKIYSFIMDPLYALLPKGSIFIFTEPMEAFFLNVKMALLAGIIIAMPVILLQVWLFIAPGLYVKEKRLALPFIVLATVGFVGGAAFAHYLLFPWMWIFFASFATDKLSFMPRIEPVFALYVKMVLAMGLVFQMPAIVYTLARIGLVTARFLIKSFKYAVLGIFVAAALITPSGDAVTMTMFAVPMVGLYLISIVIAWIFGKKRSARVEE